MIGLRWLAGALLAGGCFFFAAATLGMLRFPDVYTRLHAGTKAVTAGSILLLMGVAAWEVSFETFTKLTLIALFFLLTNPVANHAIARASYRRGIAVPRVALDQYREYVDGMSLSNTEPGDEQNGEQ